MGLSERFQTANGKEPDTLYCLRNQVSELQKASHYIFEALLPRIMLDVREFIFPGNLQGYSVWSGVYLGLVLTIPKLSTHRS